MSMDIGGTCGPDVPEPPKVFLNEPTELKILPNRRVKVLEDFSGHKRYYPQFKILIFFWINSLSDYYRDASYERYEDAIAYLSDEYGSKIKSVCYKYFN